MGGGFEVQSAVNCLPTDTIRECIEKHAEDEGFRSVDAYYWHNPQAECIETLAAQFDMVVWGDLLCDPYDYDLDGEAGEEFNPFCMPDTRRYETYKSISGCN
jgi:hypothetical protein